MANYLMTLASPQGTGAARMAYLFAASLIKRGHRVTLVHGPEPKNLPSIVPEMQSLGVETVLFAGLRLPLPWLSSKLARIIRERHSVGVIGFNQLDRAIALRSAKRAGVPGFVSAQNSHMFRGPWPLSALKSCYYAKALRDCARLVICTSPIVQQEVVSRFGLPTDRAPVLPNGIDVSRYATISVAQRESLRQELGVTTGEVLLLNVGRIDPQKGQDVLVEACKTLDLARYNAKVVLVGGASESVRDGRENDYLGKVERLIRQYGLSERVLLAGWRSDVPALLSAADGYVHSALWEGFPLSALEAMAAAKPCVWTDCSGHPPGFIEGVHGWLVPKDNAVALGGAMARMLELTAEERQRMGSACRELALERYDIDKVGARFVDMVESHSLT